MARLLKDLKLTEVSSVDKGAGSDCRIVFMKGANMDLETILKNAPAESLPNIVEQLFGVDDFDPTKTITDLLESRIVTKQGDRTRHGSWLASFTGPFPRDEIGKRILETWHRNEHKLIAVAKRKPKAVPDSGKWSGQMPNGDAVGRDGAESAFNKMVDATMQSSKCGKAQAVSKVMQTPAGTEAYRKAREARMITAATSQ